MKYVGRSVFCYTAVIFCSCLALSEVNLIVCNEQVSIDIIIVNFFVCSESFKIEKYSTNILMVEL